MNRLAVLIVEDEPEVRDALARDLGREIAPVQRLATPGKRRAVLVAAAVGLAKGTVSRALNGYPDISDATSQRVRRKAESEKLITMNMSSRLRL